MSSSEQCPIYGYYGGEDSENNELWRLYMPTKKKSIDFLLIGILI